MKKTTLFIAFLLLIPTVSNAVRADENVTVKPHAAHRFISLPEAVNFPEGITANPSNGDIYVSTFSFSANNQVLRFNKAGRLLGAIDFGGEVLLGLAFNTVDNKVYIANAGVLAGFGPSRIQRVDAGLAGLVEDVAIIPDIGAPPDRMDTAPDGSTRVIQFGDSVPVPNAMVIDSSGDLLISDSFQGAIFEIDAIDTCPTPCVVNTLAQDPLLATAGFPPFGANGLAFGDSESILYVANTGDDRVLTLDMSSAVVGIFAESINGADGLAMDDAGYLWVAANQADQVVALDNDGKVVAELGEFLRIRPDGAPDGLLFPASIAIVGKKMFVTNLALPLRGPRGGSPAEHEADVSKDTIARINIPRL